MTGALALAAMALLSAAAVLGPPWAAAVVLAAGLVLLRRRGAFLLVALSALAFNVAISALWIAPGPEGVRIGAVAALRLSAVLSANLGVLARVPPARILDDVPVPCRLRATLAAVLIAAHDVAREFERLRVARRLRGDWPRGRFARAQAAAGLLPLLLVAAHERALVRRDALRLAGHATGTRFPAVVAVAALAAAGRLALVGVPNVALTYVVVFLGGIVFGPVSAALAGALAMAATDFLLSGLHPLAFVNVPAMALLGLLGGLARRLPWESASLPDRLASRAFAASAGLLSTFLFSVAADTATWLVAYGARPAAWAPLVVAGLVFNVLPAVVNAALFAAAVTPTVRAFRALPPRAPPPQATPEPASPREPPTLPA